MKPAAGSNKAAPTDVNSINDSIMKLAVKLRQSFPESQEAIFFTFTSISTSYTNPMMNVWSE
jgi:hypothetical protein